MLHVWLRRWHSALVVLGRSEEVDHWNCHRLFRVENFSLAVIWGENLRSTISFSERSWFEASIGLQMFLQLYPTCSVKQFWQNQGWKRQNGDLVWLSCFGLQSELVLRWFLRITKTKNRVHYFQTVLAIASARPVSQWERQTRKCATSGARSTVVAVARIQTSIHHSKRLTKLHSAAGRKYVAISQIFYQ